MSKHFLLPIYFFAALFCGACVASGQGSEKVASDFQLTRQITNLDTELFDSFNRCSDPDALKRHSSLLDEHLEFYHDKGGVTWTREDYIAKTKKNVCGVFRRKIVDKSVQVYPIAGHGAIEEGKHEFCYIKSGSCFGRARFLIVWHRSPDGWKATRILSYGHEPR